MELGNIQTILVKGYSQKSCKDFRSISFYNMTYKVISKTKTITNKLQDIIKEVASLFHGLSITNNIWVTHKILRYIF